MSEYIKREDALEVIKPYLDNIDIIPFCDAKPYVREAVYGIRAKIKSIPTIEPKRGNNIERHPSCHMRTDIGNCIKIGGFCTSVNESICESLHQPKRGEWVALDERDVSGYWKCSACGTPTQAFGVKAIYKYCPFCGAEMRSDD